MDGEPTAKEFRAATGAFVGNISVITVGDGDDASGLIVTSVVAPSNDPPLLMACINRSASSHPLLVTYGRFGWSSLGAAHQAVAERFSGFGGVSGAARYDGAEWETAVTGARLLKGAPAAFDCTVEEMIDREAYSILIGRVRAIRTTAGAGGLVWWNGGFRALT
jgi:flavin reductase (DIM6/NTAB) family NADH-FMN oxidoreductase RutF